jgi:DNA-binding MarR family transcriptional regulator
MDRRAGYHLKRAQHVLRLCMDRALGDAGLTMAQYALLHALEEQPDASNADLARACFVTPQTMIETLKGLEAAGLVTRTRHSRDRRVITTALTTIGRAQLSAGFLEVDAVESRMVMGISAGDRAQLVRLLEAVTANLSDNLPRTNSSPDRRADGRRGVGAGGAWPGEIEHERAVGDHE